jgi:ATP dependent DNA ligase domain
MRSLNSLPSREAGFVEPMECLAVPKLPEGPEWVYEIKLDGYRALAINCEGKLSLYSRRRKSFHRQYVHIFDALRELPSNTVLDGEIVAGRLSFWEAAPRLRTENLIDGTPWPRTDWSPAPSFGALWAQRVRGQGTSRGLRPFLSSRWHQPGLAAILQPVALTPNVDRRRVMQQPVQDRRRDDRIAEDRSPISVTFVRGQDDAPAFVSRADQLEENRGSQIVQR